MVNPEEIEAGLRKFYANDVERRDRVPKSDWKLAERRKFLAHLQKAGKNRLLEIGCGTGHDSLYFQSEGLTVTCTDLSPEMIARCQEKGLDAQVMDFRTPHFSPGSFDALYALNCLLHVPAKELPESLQTLSILLEPGGLFYLGLYGGEEKEGFFSSAPEQLPRFYSFHTHEQIEQT